MPPTLRTRKPTGVPPWPLVLLEGAEKSGKSWAAAVFTASDRIGRAYWLDLGEGAADDYAAIPGTKYEVIVHNGTWGEIIDQVTAVHAEAQAAVAGDEPPLVLVIDSMTDIWELLKDWTGQRARESKMGKRQLQADPNAEVKASTNLWNDANERHTKLMRLLMTFPGIVVMTARGKEVASIDTKGNPIPGVKDYRVEGHKNLAFDATAWVRLSRNEPPTVVGVRSVHSGLRPGVDEPVQVPDFTVEWLVFDLLRCDPSVARSREMAIKPEFAAVVAQVMKAKTREEITAAWTLARDADYIDMADEEGISLRDTLSAKVERVKAAEAEEKARQEATEAA